jgi:hypothetical protein
MTTRARVGTTLLSALGAAALLCALATAPAAAEDRQTGTVKSAPAPQDEIGTGADSVGINSERQSGTVK